MPAKKVSIINMKGGVGKTTLSFNIANYLAEKEHKKVLLIDLDPQANASLLCIPESQYRNHLKNKKTVADLFMNSYKSFGPYTKPASQTIVPSEFIYNSYNANGKLDIVPSDIYLSSILRGVYIRPFDLYEFIIKQIENDYDYIFIDCAPTYSSLTTQAFISTGAVLIPVMADIFGVYGVELMEQILKEHEADFGQKINIVGLVFTMFEKKSTPQVRLSNDIITKWGKNYTFKTKISKSGWYKVANGRRTTLWKTPGPMTEFKNFITELKSKI